MDICERLQDIRPREVKRTTAENTIRHGRGRSKILIPLPPGEKSTKVFAVVRQHVAYVFFILQLLVI